MPDQPPELIEKIGDAPEGSTWRARLPTGQEMLATQRLIADESGRQAALDRLRRLARIPPGHLAPVRGWWADGQGAWVVSDLEQGLALPDLPGGGFLSPQQASAIGFGVLGGLEALHGEGLSHGALGPSSVRILPDGQVLLTGHELSTPGFPGQDDLVSEIQEAGRLICQAFGITPERTGGAPRAIEHAAPALVVTARAIAAGNMHSDVKAATAALRETSGPLAGVERLSLGASELGALVSAKLSGSPAELHYRNLNAPIGGGGAVSPTTPAPPEPPAAVAARPTSYTPPFAAAPPAADPAAPARRSYEERKAAPIVAGFAGERTGPNWLLIGGVLVALVVVALVLWAGRGLLLGSSTGDLSGGTPLASPSASSSGPPSSPGTVSPTPGAVPTFAPTSAGIVKSVTVKPNSTACAPGSSCTFNVVILFTPAGSPHDVTWSFKTFDPCTGSTNSFPGGTITAEGSWNTTDGNTTISLPAAKGVLNVVALSGPDVAASTPAVVGTGGC